jgi:mono/diheme cytochrome c family protein
MRSTFASIAIAAALAAAVPALAQSAATVPALAQNAATERRARNDYLLHCSGCHDIDGSGHPSKGIPDFRNQIGYFTMLPEGRAMLMQIPGLLSSGLPDDRAAAVTTWLVRQFAGASLPPDFLPYSAEEARRYRETRPADITATRERLYREIAAAGYEVK